MGGVGLAVPLELKVGVGESRPMLLGFLEAAAKESGGDGKDSAMDGIGGDMVWENGDWNGGEDTGF
jgi:hypothetical protein